MTTKPEYRRAQAALVRMIYDPAFADAVRSGEHVLELSPSLRDALAAIDPRPLRRDRHRRERTLALLCDELPRTTTLLRRMHPPESLLAFYGSAHFHDAIEHDQSLVLAFGAFLQALVRTPEAAAVLALELACAQARRDRGSAPMSDRLRRATGIEPIEVPRGALELLGAVERAEAELPPLAPGTTTLAAILLDGEVTLVEIARPLWAILYALPRPRTRASVLDEAALRLDGDRAAATAALEELLGDELVLF
jgi:hypothetical protein